MFVLPPLILLASLGIGWGIGKLQSPGWRRSAGALFGAALVVTAVDMVRLHPNQCVYFNRLLAGGVAHAARAFETD